MITENLVERGIMVNRRKLCLYCLLLLLCAVLLPAGYLYWQRRIAAAELRAVLMELDENEPGWRLEQLEANRREVPDELNGALVVLAASRGLPERWDSEITDALYAVPPPIRLPAGVVEQLRRELQLVEKGLADARRLVDLPHGRFPIVYSPDFMSTQVEHLQASRRIGTLLRLDAFRAIQDQQPDEAWRAIRSLLNAGHSLGDEPGMMPHLVRMALQGMTVQCLERALAHAAIGEPELAAMQTALAEEANEPLFLLSMRGQRAGTHRFFIYLTNEAPSIAVTVEEIALASPKRAPGWRDHFNDWFAMKAVYRSHAWVMRFHTEIIRTAAEKPGEQYRKLDHWDNIQKENAVMALTDRDLRFAHLFRGSNTKIARAEQRNDSHLHCVIAGLAAERFRMKHERWPKSLTELTDHKLLAVVPEDLFNGQPLRIRHSADGFVIYSVGPEEKYLGDGLDQLEKFDPVAARVEFRLWNPDLRRQAAIGK